MREAGVSTEGALLVTGSDSRVVKQASDERRPFTDIDLGSSTLHRGGDRDARISRHRRYGKAGIRWADRLLGEDEVPTLGAHLVSPRRGFTHHGIYVGDGKVVHYGALAHYLHRGPVEEVSLAYFRHGHPLGVRSREAPHFDCAEVIRRARSRVGEDHYRLLSNNCEHFCEWCLRGEPRSYQVELWTTRLERMRHSALSLFRTSRIHCARRSMSAAITIVLALLQLAAPT